MKCSKQAIFSIVVLLSIIFAVFISVILYYFVSTLDVDCNYNFINQNEKYDKKPLFLTPYIKNGEIDKGQEKAFVKNWNGIHSYSGYLTMNKTYNSNLFFWFFPHPLDFDMNTRNKSDESAQVPIILYLQGGPGMSSLFGLFLETGPFQIDSKLNLSLRKYSWTEKHSMLYIDSPVGSGFSFTDNKNEYAKEQTDVSRYLYEALTQFFRLFPKFLKADFYIAGTSYAGKYIPVLSYKIHLENKKKPLVRINLKGIAIGSGYFDPIVHDNFSDYYYNMGLIDEKHKKFFQQEENRIKVLLKAERYTEARDAIKSIYYTRKKVAGIRDNFIHNALEPYIPSDIFTFETFLNKKCIRSAIHVGEHRFSIADNIAHNNFVAKDFSYSTKFELEKLLNANYKILIYASQFDTIIIHTGISKFLRILEWPGGHTFRSIPRQIWKVDGIISGYVKETGYLIYTLIRNAGHIACYDQSQWCLDMINRFTNGSSFRDVLTS